MIMLLAYVVVILSVRLICQAGIIGKIAHTMLAIGVLGVADNIDNNQALMRSCFIVALSFLIFMLKGNYNGPNRRHPGL